MFSFSFLNYSEKKGNIYFLTVNDEDRHLEYQQVRIYATLPATFSVVCNSLRYPVFLKQGEVYEETFGRGFEGDKMYERVYSIENLFDNKVKDEEYFYIIYFLIFRR